MNMPKQILAEPYRLFFPIGWAMGIIGASYWLFVSAGILQSYLPLYHGVIQIELFCSAFAIGFLMTALPKFLQTRAASVSELTAVLLAYSALASAVLLNELYLAQWMFIATLLLLAGFAITRFGERKSAPPYSFLLVAFGLLEGLAGAFLLNHPASGFPMLGQKFLEQGMFLSLCLGIGSFLGPRLMGVVDPVNARFSLPQRAHRTVSLLRSPGAAVFLIGALIFSSFPVEVAVHREAGWLVRGVATIFCLERFGLFKLPKRESMSGIFAAVSIWCLAAGTLLPALFPASEVGALHLMYIGGFGALILTIGAQVTQSHGGVHRFWQTNKIRAVLVSIGILCATIFRVSASFVPDRYFAMLAAAAVSFDAALLIWGFSVLRYLTSKPQRAILGPEFLDAQRKIGGAGALAARPAPGPQS